MNKRIQLNYLNSIHKLSNYIGIKIDLLDNTIKDFEIKKYGEYILYTDAQVIMDHYKIHCELDDICIFSDKIKSLDTYNIKDKKYTIGIIGHVDHGKTTLISNMINKQIDEVKDITQDINIYECQDIYIIDTPGHSCFHHYRSVIVPHIDIIVIVVSMYDGIETETIKILNMVSKDFSYMKSVLILTKQDIARYSKVDIMNEINKYGINNIISVLESSKHTNIYSDLITVIEDKSSIQKRQNMSLNVMNINNSICMLCRVSSSELNVKSFILFENKVLRVRKILNINKFKPVNNVYSISYCYVYSDITPSIGKFYVTQCVKEARMYEKIVIYKKHIENINKNIEKKSSVSFTFICSDIMSINTVVSMLKERNMDKYSTVIQYTDINSINIISKTSSVVVYNVHNKQIENSDGITIIDYIYDLEEFMNNNNHNIYSNSSVSGIAKIIKVFDIKGRHVAGCKVIKGSFMMNGQVSIIEDQSFDIKKIQKFNIVSLKKEKQLVTKVNTGDIFGIVVDSHIEYKIDMNIVTYEKTNRRKRNRH